MLGFVIRRALWAVLLLVVVSFVTFVLFFVVASAETRIGRGASAEEFSIRESFGVERSSVPLEYAQVVWTVVRYGSLGQSFVSRREVTDVLADAIPITASLLLGGVAMFLLLAIPIGVFSALRQRSVFDRASMVLILIGVSAHPAWIGLILSYVVGFRLGLTPIGGYCDLVDPSTGCGGATDWAYHLILPWLTFAILFAALYARMIRASVLETLDEDYVRTARAKGAPRSVVLRSHVFRNAMLPVVTMLGLDIGLAFGGSIFVETVYGLPGVGRIGLQAIARRDLPVVMGVVLLVTTAIVVVNMLVDLLYGWLDPRTAPRSSRSARREAAALRHEPSPAPLSVAPRSSA